MEFNRHRDSRAVTSTSNVDEPWRQLNERKKERRGRTALIIHTSSHGAFGRTGEGHRNVLPARVRSPYGVTRALRVCVASPRSRSLTSRCISSALSLPPQDTLVTNRSRGRRLGCRSALFVIVATVTGGPAASPFTTTASRRNRRCARNG